MSSKNLDKISLRNLIPLKLVISLLLIMGIGGGIGFTLDNMAIREQERIFNQQQLLQAKLAATALGDHLDSIAGTGQIITRYSLRDYFTGKRSIKSIQKLFRIKQGIRNAITFISVHNSPSNTVISSDLSSPEQIKVQKIAEKWVRKYYSTLSGLHTGMVTPRPVISKDLRLAGMLFPIWRDNNFHGVLAIIIDLRVITQKYITSLKIGDFGSGFIFDGSGTVLYDQEQDIMGMNIFELHQDFPALVKLDSKMLHEPSGKGEYVFFTVRGGEKVRKLIAWDTARIGDMKMVVAISSPESEATRTMDSIRATRVAMVVFLGLTIFFIIFFFYYYRSKMILIEQHEELKRKDRIFDAIASNVPGTIYKCGPMAPYVMEYISPKVNKLTGYDQLDFINGGKAKFYEIIHEEDRNKVKIAIEDAISKGKSFTIEYRITTQDGACKWIYERGRKVAESDSVVGFILDITERKNEIEALHEAEEKYRLMVDNAPVGIYQSTPDGKFLSANPQLASYYGYISPEDLIREVSNISTQCYVSPDNRRRLATILNEFGKTTHFEAEHTCRDGSTFWASETVTAIKDEERKVIRYDGFLIDISERKDHEETMRRLAMYDNLTGLPNRTLFDDRIKQAISHAERSGLSVAVLYADLDNFKPVNDELGHMAGDAVLKDVAGRFSDCLRTTDTVSRIGGDEFIFILQDIGSKNEIEVVAQRIIDTMRLPFYISERVYRLGVSIGISIYPENGTEKEVLVRHADEAMYRAKSNGKNNFSY